MDFILVTTYSAKSSIVEELMDNTVLKEVGYQAKYNSTNLIYDNILIPYVQEINDEEFKLTKHLINNIPGKYKYSVYLVFKEVLKYNITFQFNMEINDSQFGIFYTDGSFSKNNQIASYGCCKLLQESEDGLEDYFTKKKYLYETFNGKVDVATNNVGELTGIKTAIENFNDKVFQIIISDSIYSIKSFREWIYNWKANNYKGSTNKEIKNKELIIETFDLMKKSNKIIIFKWTKGHAGDNFNEICDKKAKEISGGK